MSTEDPNGFDAIGFYDEIGQPTYVELISVKRKTELAFKPPIRGSVVALPVEPQVLAQATPRATPYIIGKSVIETATKQMKAARVKQAKQEIQQRRAIRIQSAQSAITIQSAPVSTTNLTQVLSIDLYVSGGTFTLTLDTQTTSAITIESSLFKLEKPSSGLPPTFELRTDVLDALAASIESKLEALSNVGSGNVTVVAPSTFTGDRTARFTITFVNDLAQANVLPLVPGSLSLTFSVVYVQDGAPSPGGFGFDNGFTNNGLGQNNAIGKALAIVPTIAASGPGIYPINNGYAAPLAIGSRLYHTYPVPASDLPSLSTLQLVGWKTEYSTASVSQFDPSSNGYVRFSYGGNYTAPISVQSIAAWANSAGAGPIYTELNKLPGLAGNIISVVPNSLFPMGENYGQYANLPATGYFAFQNEFGFVIRIKASAAASQIGIDTSNIVSDPTETAVGFEKTLRSGTTEASAFDFTYVVAAAISGTYRVIFNVIGSPGLTSVGAIGSTPTTYTAALAYNASASTIQSAIEAIPTIGSGNVTVTGSYADGVGIFNVKFVGKFLTSSGDPYTMDLAFGNGSAEPYGGPFATSTQLWISGFDWSFGTHDHGTFNVGGSEIPWNASHAEVATALIAAASGYSITDANGNAACDNMFYVEKSNASLSSPSAGEPPVQINSAFQRLRIIGGYARPLQNLTFGIYGIGGLNILSGPPTGGTFTFRISINGSTTTVGPVSYFASAADVKSAILTATGISSSLIDVYKVHSGAWDIVFAISLGPTPVGIVSVDATNIRASSGWILDVTLASGLLSDTDFFVDTNGLEVGYQRNLQQSQNKGYITVDAETTALIVPTPTPPPTITPCTFTDVALSLQWNRMQLDTTYLHHIYGLFLKVTVRDPDDPSVRTTVCLLPTGSTSLRGDTGKWWTVSNPPPSPSTASGSQTNFHSMFIRGGYAPSETILCQTAAGTLVSVGEASLPTNDYIYTNLNILESPASGGIDTNLDKVRFTFPSFLEGEVESIGVYMLSRRVYEDGSSTFLDPEDQTLTATISYTRNSIQKNFSSTIIMEDLYSNLEDNGDLTTKARWDEFPAINISGPRTFTFDAISNAGLDQCTTHTMIAKTGSGNLVMNAPGYLLGYGNCVQGCGGSIDVTTINDASGQDEIQSVILPDRAASGAGGTWTLTFNGRTTEGITAYASAAQVKAALEAIWGTEYPDNIVVTGQGTASSPYIITFTQDLGRVNWSQMTGSGANLTGSASVFVQTSQGGTSNEIQKISRSGVAPGAKNEIQKVGYTTRWLHLGAPEPTGTFTLTYNGFTTTNIPAIDVDDLTASAAAVKAALLALPSLDENPDDITVVPGYDDAITGYVPRRFLMRISKNDLTSLTSSNTFTLTYNGVTSISGQVTNAESAIPAMLESIGLRGSGGFYTHSSSRDSTNGDGLLFSPALSATGDTNGYIAFNYTQELYNGSGQFAPSELMIILFVTDPAGYNNFYNGGIIGNITLNVSAGLTGVLGPIGSQLWMVERNYFMTVTFLNRKAYTNVPQIGVNTAGIVGPSIVRTRINEFQQVYFSTSATSISGSFTLTFDGQTTGPISLVTESDGEFYLRVTAALEALSNIPAGSIAVYSRFQPIYTYSRVPRTSRVLHIEFIGDMQQTNLPLLSINTSGIVTVPASTTIYSDVISINDGGTGTPTPALTISTTTQEGSPGNPPSFALTLNGSTTSTLVNNSSLAQVRTALELLPTIGVGNIRVYTDLNPAPSDTAAMFGPWYLEFIGDLEATNIAQTTVSPTTNYLAETLVQGGVGQYEIQVVTLQGATGGTFTLSYNGVTSIPIAWNASAATVLSALTPIIGFTITVSGSAGGPWSVSFVGLTASDAALLVGNGANLTGGTIVIDTIRDGSFGGPEIQQVAVTHSVGGTFTLTYTNPLTDVTQTTGLIPYNATAQQIQAALLALSGVQNHDFSVIGEPGGPWTITFSTRLGDVEPLIGDATNLLCVPIVLNVVPPGPYPYDITPPVDRTPDPEVDPCCPVDGTMPDEANIASFFVYQRDLFDPNKVVNDNRLSIGQLASTRGHDISKFTPYLRSGGRLTLASFSDIAQSRTSIVLIENTIDTANNRDRMLTHFAGSREILPMRML